MQVVFSAASQQDLRDIASYIMQDNPIRALSFVEELEARCLSLSDQPDRGALRHRLLRDLRLIPHRGYNIFYRREGAEVKIVRIIHGARRVRRKDFT